MRAWVMITPTGINVGTEHVRCPDTWARTQDEGYVARATADAHVSEKAVKRALDLATDAIEPRWLIALRSMARVLWFLRPLVERLCRSRCWSFCGGMDHRAFDCCTWSADLEVVERLRSLAAAEAARALTLFGYGVGKQAFNLPPGGVPTVE